MHLHRAFALPLLAATAPLCAQNGLWAQLAYPASPSPRLGAALAYDTARDRLVLVGGTPNQAFAFQETWENDGATWLLRTTTGPRGSAIWYPQEYLAAVYDQQRQRVLAVQSDVSTGAIQTWEWDGSAWLHRAPALSPPGRNGFALAYDSARGRAILFGGTAGGAHFADTWEWDGTTWVQRANGGPAPRQLAAMAFDSVRNVTVLFGGRVNGSSPATFGDTWEWNGQFWLEHFGATGPAPRRAHGMTFDSARGVTVMHGGSNPTSVGGGTWTDTWEWNGVQWTNRQATTPAATWAPLAFDGARQRVVMFGGEGVFGQVHDTTFAYTATAIAAAATAYGAGCAGPAGVPVLAAQPGSVPRLGATLQLRLTSLPTGGLNVPIGWVGFDDQQWNGLPLPLALDPLGFPGCQALLAPVSAYTLSNVAGTADWPLAIPFLPAFAGFEFFAQGSVFVPGFNPGGLVFSNAVACTVGR
jgi:hypothetical protein